MEQNETTEFNQENVDASSKMHKKKFHWGNFFMNNKKGLTIGVSAIVLLLGCYLGYKYFIVEPGQEEANNKAYKAEDMMDFDDSLMYAMNGDAKMGITGLKEIADDYGYTKAGKRAALRIGKILLEQGKTDEAIEYLEKFDLGDKVAQTHALGNLGQAYSDKKEYEKAASYFQKAADHAKLINISARYQKLAGLAYEELKEYEKAADCYQKVQKEYFNSDQARDIEKYIERAKGLAKTKK
ncbi:MAG: tetratricopeptide repeat protein [Bacteroidota bacterium]|nr:tetratricopeptide repeat protein [Bacteroidota bacterium]